MQRVRKKANEDSVGKRDSLNPNGMAISGENKIPKRKK